MNFSVHRNLKILLLFLTITKPRLPRAPTQWLLGRAGKTKLPAKKWKEPVKEVEKEGM